MKISYTGRHEEFPPRQLAKFEAKIQKLSKLLERRGEKEAHVILSQERFLRKVEITIHAWDHDLVGAASDSDLVTAANAALERLEKQVLKVRTKFRDTKRHPGEKSGESQPEPAAARSKSGTQAETAHGRKSEKKQKKIFRVNHRDGNKPMTLEEAILEIEATQDYMVYRDAQTDRVHVLMRRPDGHFDLIES